MIKESYKILNTARRYIVKHMQYIVKHMQYIVKHISAPAGLGKTLRLSRDHGISPKGFLTEGRPIWSPFLTFLKKLLTFCGHGLGGLWFFPGPGFSWLRSELFLPFLFFSLFLYS